MVTFGEGSPMMWNFWHQLKHFSRGKSSHGVLGIFVLALVPYQFQVLSTEFSNKILSIS